MGGVQALQKGLGFRALNLTFFFGFGLGLGYIMVYDFTLVCLHLHIIVAFSRSSDSVNYLGFQISDEKTLIIQISDNYPNKIE